MCSEKTIYNYIDDCLMEVRNIDLPRKVRFRVRRKKPEFKVDKGCRVGRSFKEFEAFMKKNDNMLAPVVYPGVLGITAPDMNAGEFEAWGYEGQLTWRDKIGKDFCLYLWSTSP